MDDALDVTSLQQKAAELRRLVIRSLHKAGSGHAASSLGLSDFMAAMYFKVLRIDPAAPDWPERDIFVMSNGHCAPVLYATLALRGFFAPEELLTLRQFQTRLQGHPERSLVPGVETTSGPLGSGLSQASGMAYSLKYLRRQPRRVYCLMGDGELDEGNVWEAAMFAAKYRLDNVVAVVDRNYIQIGGDTEEVMPLGDLRAKWQSFGWHVEEIDGHNITEIVDTLNAVQAVKGAPTVVLMRTVPGKGVDFMEGDYHWHGKAPNDDEARRALEQLK